MRYEIACGDSVQSLEESMASYISMGWIPIGGVSVVCGSGGGFAYYQAIVKTV